MGIRKQTPPNLRKLRQVLPYDPNTGLFTRLTGPRAGHLAGCLHYKGYVEVLVLGRLQAAHRLAWYMHYGIWPVNDVDHKDRIRNHNWIGNLREATRKQNAANRSKWQVKELPLEVQRRENGKYTAVIWHNNTNKYLGSFSTEQEAAAAYKAASLQVHGQYSPFSSR